MLYKIIINLIILEIIIIIIIIIIKIIIIIIFFLKGMSDYQVIPKFSYDMPKLAKAIKDLDGIVQIIRIKKKLLYVTY